jgi:tetraacyldisaccharide 4'-kinase
MIKSPARFLLLPFSLLYGLVTGTRNKLFDLGILKQSETEVFTLVVGNLSMGGTGKTPHVIHLATTLKTEYPVAILSRGYKRKSKGFRWVSAEDTVDLSGDEALEIKIKLPDVPVAADGDRRRGIMNMVKELNPKPKIIILDDGFQHRFVKPNFSLLLTSIGHLYSKDYLLPVGRLRESRKNARRANAICVTGDQGPVNPEELREQLKIYDHQKLFTSRPIYHFSQNLELTHETSIILVTAIADPLPLKRYLESFNCSLEHIRFKDHHNYSQNDINKIIRIFSELDSRNKVVLTSAKDIVKLKSFADFSRLPYAVVEIDIEFNHNGQENLITEIKSHVGKN